MGIDYYIHGGRSLRGSVSIKGSPLAAVGTLAVSLLCQEKVTLTNVPHLHDLDSLLDELRQVGVVADWTSNHEITLHGAAVNQPLSLSLETVAGWSPSLLTALLVRTKRIDVSCEMADFQMVYGDRLIWLVKQFGGRISMPGIDRVTLELSHLHGAEVTLSAISADEAVSAVVLASLAEGTSLVDGVLFNPEVDAVIECAVAMGAAIERLSESRLRIEGQTALRGATCDIVADRYEAALFAAAAILTKGDLLVTGIKPAMMMSFLAKLQQYGATYHVGGDGIRFWADGHQSFRPLNVAVRPFPGLSSDWMAIILPLLCLADGESQIQTEVDGFLLEGALAMVKRFGGEVASPGGQARVFGPTKPKPALVEADSFGAAMVAFLQALAATGDSRIANIDEVDGRFEDLARRLVVVGAQIDRREEAV